MVGDDFMEKLGNFDKEFRELMMIVGQEIDCVYFDNGVLREISGVLQEVYPYDSVCIDEGYINFWGEGKAILYLISDGKVIYKNKDARRYKGTNRDGIMAQVIEQQRVLGFSDELAVLADYSRTIGEIKMGGR